MYMPWDIPIGNIHLIISRGMNWNWVRNNTTIVSQTKHLKPEVLDRIILISLAVLQNDEHLTDKTINYALLQNLLC